MFPFDLEEEEEIEDVVEVTKERDYEIDFENHSRGKYKSREKKSVPTGTNDFKQYIIH